MRALGRSSLFKHVAQQVFPPNATMQAVVDRGRRALLLFYDGWGRDARFEVAGTDGTKVKDVTRCLRLVIVSMHHTYVDSTHHALPSIHRLCHPMHADAGV